MKSNFQKISAVTVTAKDKRKDRNMNDRETGRYEMFGRADTFGKDNAVDFPAATEGAKRFTNFLEPL